MTLTVRQLQSVIEELRALVIRGRVRRVLCPDRDALALELRVPGENRYLVVSLAPGAGRMHLVDERPARRPEPSSLVMLLRKHLTAMGLAAIEQIPGDRIARLRFEAAGGEPRSLVAELTGRHSAVLLLDERDRILGIAGAERIRRRRTAGDAWTPPPAPPEPAARVLDRDPLDLGSLAPDGSRSRRIEEYYREQAVRTVSEETSRRLLRRLRDAVRALERRERAVAGDRGRAERADEYRRRGELLQSAYGKVSRGAMEVEVADFYEEGLPRVSIPLDPALDLQGNIDRYFRLYRKYHAAVARIDQRLEATRERLEAARTATDRVRELEGRAEDLIALERELEERRVLRATRSKPARGERGPRREALPYRSFVSRAGRQILVGKGGRHNDTLTLRVAHGNDLWLHVRDWPGAHVVIRLNRGEEVDQETLLDAATLAVHYSKAKGAGQIDVETTLVKHVRKPRGLAPGKVLLASARTLHLRVETERLDRLLARES